MRERVESPVLVLKAENSAIPPPLLERIEAAVPDLRVQQIAASTHFAALERPNEVGARLGRFAAEVASGY